MNFWIFWIFPVFSGFFRILISCSNFDLKKKNVLILYFLKFLFFIFIFYFYFLIFLLNSVKKKLSQFLKIPKVNVPEPPFSIYLWTKTYGLKTVFPLGLFGLITILSRCLMNIYIHKFKNTQLPCFQFCSLLQLLIQFSGAVRVTF